MPEKPKLLVQELWALGDLVLATPFLRAAREKFAVTLLAKPMARELQPRLWPDVEIIPFVAPWTAFQGKYRLHRWPWREFIALRRELRGRRFDIAACGRRDERDHAVMRLSAAPRRIGFPRVGSRLLLTECLDLPKPGSHRMENWRQLGGYLGLNMPPKPAAASSRPGSRKVVIHTGAAQPTRIWPLDRFQYLIVRLRKAGFPVEIICDPSQSAWWLQQGESPRTPSSLTELMDILESAALFVGNDSGPGHIAATLGVPTFTIFGNQFPDAFAPWHADADWIEGAPCPYKPCYDSCRFAQPNCLFAITAEAAWAKLTKWVEKTLG